MRILDPVWKVACICGLLGMTGCSSDIFSSNFVSQLFGTTDATKIAAQGNDALQKGDADGADKLFTQALDAKTLSPADSALALLNRGLAREKLAKHEDALADFTAALALNALATGDAARADYDRGVALDELNRMPEAIAAFSDALQLQPQFAAAYNNRGNAHLRLGDLAGAKSDYEAALAANIEAPEYVYYGLGQIAEGEGDIDAARDCYRHALGANPGYAVARARLVILDKDATPPPATPQIQAKITGADFSLRPSIDGQPAEPQVPASTVQIQLGAYRDEATATQTWSRLSAQTGGLLSGLTPNIVSVDLPERGRFYRLRAGVSDGNAAASLCGRLNSKGIDCIPVKG